MTATVNQKATATQYVQWREEYRREALHDQKR